MSASGEGLFPLSPAQLGIWYAQHVDPQVPITVALYVDLHGELDVSMLERALIDTSHELGSWFLRVIEHDGEPWQWVDSSIADSDGVEHVDFRNADDPVATATEWMRADYSRPLNIVTDRLIKVAALQLDDDHWFWYARAHHIALDGFGAMTNVRRIAQLYTAYDNGTEPTPSEAVDQRTLVESEFDYRESEEFASDKEYWAQRVAGLEAGTSLVGRSAAPAPLNRIASAVLSDEQNGLLEAASTRLAPSRPGLLIAAFATYMAQWTGSEDVVLSLPVTARTTRAMRRSGGAVSNIVPLRLRVGYDTTIADLLQQIQTEVMNALSHQRYRHEDIRRDNVGDGAVDRGYFGPWINIMLFLDELMLGPMSGRLHVLSTGSIEDLGVNFYQSQGGAGSRIDFETNPNLYTEGETREHHSRFLEFFGRFLAADADTAVWSLDVTTGDERERTLLEWNDSEQDVPETTLAALLDAQMPLTPDNIALDFEGTTLAHPSPDRHPSSSRSATLTYSEFHARVNRLARFLIADGVGPESLVALGMRRSLELVIGMHAVVKAG
ncbi:condensation domain-containing protein, partial [Nocardia amamiensis]